MRLKRYAFDLALICAIVAVTGCGVLSPFLTAPARTDLARSPASGALRPQVPRVADTAAASPAAAAPAAAPPEESPVLVAAPRERLAEHIARTYRIAAAPALQIVDDVYRAADRQQLPPTLLLAVIAQESSFRPHAVSRVGAVGLMQVRPEFHDRRRSRLGLRRPLTDSATNIAVGAEVLKECLAKNGGDVARALARYSGGARNYPRKVARIESLLVEVARGTATTCLPGQAGCGAVAACAPGVPAGCAAPLAARVVPDLLAQRDGADD